MAEGRNQLRVGDNLEIPRDHVRDESVDLVYLDPLKDEALAAGVYKSELWNGMEFKRIQILTIQDIFDGKNVEFPLVADSTYRRARRKPNLPPGTQLVMEGVFEAS